MNQVVLTIVVVLGALLVSLPNFVESWEKKVDIDDILKSIAEEEVKIRKLEAENVTFGRHDEVEELKNHNPTDIPKRPYYERHYTYGMPPFLWGFFLANLMIPTLLVFYLLGGPESLQKEKQTCSKNKCFKGCKPQIEDEFWPHDPDYNRPHHHRDRYRHHVKHSDLKMAAMFAPQDSIF